LVLKKSTNLLIGCSSLEETARRPANYFQGKDKYIQKNTFRRKKVEEKFNIKLRRDTIILL